VSTIELQQQFDCTSFDAEGMSAMLAWTDLVWQTTKNLVFDPPYTLLDDSDTTSCKPSRVHHVGGSSPSPPFLRHTDCYVRQRTISIPNPVIMTDDQAEVASNKQQHGIIIYHIVCTEQGIFSLLHVID